MASVTFAIYSVALLALANGFPATDNDAKIELEVPEECKGMVFCSVPPVNYKEIQDRIEKLIPKDLLTEVEDRLGPNYKDFPQVSDEQDWHNCPTTSNIESPNIVQDPIHVDKYKAVVQLKNKFEQNFVAVKCPQSIISEISNGSDDRQCFPDLFPHLSRNAGMTSKCVQRYSSRTLYVYDHESNTLVMEPYRIPVYCSCKLSPSI